MITNPGFFRLYITGLSVVTVSNTYTHNSLFTVFSIRFRLTDIGFSNFEKVLQALFSYLLLLKSTDSFYDIYEELKKTYDISFRFRDDSLSSPSVKFITLIKKSS